MFFFKYIFLFLLIKNINNDGSPEVSEGMMEPVSPAAAAARCGVCVCVWVREWGGEREGCVCREREREGINSILLAVVASVIGPVQLQVPTPHRRTKPVSLPTA